MLKKILRNFLSLTLALTITAGSSLSAVYALDNENTASYSIPSVPEVPNIGIEKPTNDTDYKNTYDIVAESVNITEDGAYLINGDGTQTSNFITVADGVKAFITIRDVNIASAQAMNCGTGAKVEMNIEGDNNFSSTQDGKAAVAVPDGGSLIIGSSNDGVLNASTTTYSHAPAIGANDVVYNSPGDIYITGGNINAVGGAWGAGIGGSANGSVNRIVITGGNINSRCDLHRGAGIGCGASSSITDGIYITGGTIYASSNYEGGAGIGCSEYGSANRIVITGGDVTALSNSSAGIGAGMHSNVGDIYITGGTVNATSTACGAGIGAGENGLVNGDIVILNANVTAKSTSGAGLGAGSNGKVNGNIIINSSNVNAFSNNAYAIGYGSNTSTATVTSVNIDSESNVVASSAGADKTYGADVLNLSGRELITFNFLNPLSNSKLYLISNGQGAEVLIADSAKSTTCLINPDNEYNLVGSDNFYYNGTDGSGTSTTVFKAGSYNDVAVTTEKINLNVSYIVADKSKIDFFVLPENRSVDIGTIVDSIVPDFQVIDKDYRASVIINIAGVDKEIYDLDELATIKVFSDMTLTLNAVKRTDSLIVFNPNNGSTVSKVNVGIGEPVEAPTEPERNKYSFIGWFDENDNLWDFAKGVNYDMTLTAKWEYDSIPSVPEVPNILNELGIEKPTNDTDYKNTYDIVAESVNITEDGAYLIYSSDGTQTSNFITVADGVKAFITIRDVNIASAQAMNCGTGAKVELNIKGFNNFSSTQDGKAAISVPDGGSLIIGSSNNGILNASTTTYAHAPAIGANDVVYNSPGDIYITGGSINAVGGAWGAGVGGSANGSVNRIVITGGNINSRCDLHRGAGIGCGASSSITDGIYITGGTIYASSNYEGGAGIGCSEYGSANRIVITGGDVTALSNSSAGIGAGMHSNVGDIYITGGTVNATSTACGAGIGAGENGLVNGDIVILNANVTAKSTSGAGLGAGSNGLVKGDIFISNANVTAKSTSGAGLGAGNNGKVDGDIIINFSNVNAFSQSAYAIGYGLNTSTATVTSVSVDSKSNVVASSGEADKTYSSDVLNLSGKKIITFNFLNPLSNLKLNLISNGQVMEIPIVDSTKSTACLVNPDNEYNLISSDNFYYKGADVRGSNTTVFKAGSYNDVAVTAEKISFNVSYIVVDKSKIDFIESAENRTVDFGTTVDSIMPDFQVIDKDYRASVIINIAGVDNEIYNLEELAKVKVFSDMSLTLNAVKRTDSLIVFDPNNGSTISSVTVGIGEPVEIPTEPERNKYSFIGWFDENDNLWDFANGVNYDMTLTAKWEYDGNNLVFPTIPDTLNELGIEKPTSDSDYYCCYNIEKNPVTIGVNGAYLVYGNNNATGNYLQIKDNVTAYVTIRNINVDRKPVGIEIGNGAKVTLNIEGENIVRGNGDRYFGRYGYGILTPASDGYCVITADNLDQKLTAAGTCGGICTLNNAAPQTQTPGDIFITGGTITSSSSYLNPYFGGITNATIGASLTPVNNIVIKNSTLNIDASKTAIGSAGGAGKVVGGIFIKNSKINAKGNNSNVESHSIIGSSGSASVGDIIIDNSELTLSNNVDIAKEAAAIGTGDNAEGTVGDIIIKSSKVNIQSNFKLVGIGSATGSTGNIIINDTELDILTSLTAIGALSSDHVIKTNGSVGDIIIINSHGKVATRSRSAVIGGRSKNITIKSSDFNSYTGDYDGLSSGQATIVGANWGETVGDITLYDTHISVPSGCEYISSVVGAGRQDSTVGNIDISKSSIIVSEPGASTNVNAAIVGGGSNNSTVGDITISDSDIKSWGYAGAGVGGSWGQSQVGDITISNSNLYFENVGSVTIGAGNNSKVGNIKVNNSTVDSTGYFGIGSYDSSTTENIDIINSELNLNNTVSSIGNSSSSAETCGSTGNINIENSVVKAYSDGVTIGENNDYSTIGSLSISENSDIQFYSKSSSAISKDILDNPDDIPTIYQGTFATTFSEDQIISFDNALTDSELLLKAGYKTFAVKSVPDTWNYVFANDTYFKGYMTYPTPNSEYTMNYYTANEVITKYDGLTPTEYSWICYETDGKATIEPESIKIISGGKLPYLPTLTPQPGYEFSRWDYEYYTSYMTSLGYAHRGSLYNYDDIMDWYYEFGDKTKVIPDENETKTMINVELDYDFSIVIWDNLDLMANSFESRLGGKFVFKAIQAPILYDYTVKYVDEAGNSIAPAKKGQAYYETEVVEKPIKINGYTPIDKQKSLIMDFENNEIVFKYQVGETTRQLSVVVLEESTNYGVKATVNIKDSSDNFETLKTDNNGYVITNTEYEIGDNITINVSDLSEQYLEVTPISYTVSSDDDVIYVYVRKNDKFIITGYNNDNSATIYYAIASLVLFAISITAYILSVKRFKRKKESR